MSDRDTPPQYDVEKVEALILETAVEVHPRHLSTGGLLLKVVGDPADRREIDTGIEAVHNLREAGLFVRRDEIVEPTPAAVRAVKLLA